jgi:hypothetical protein
MLIKTKIALAAAVMLGAVSVALAADDDQHGGFRELGNGATVKEGINPVDHPSLSGQPVRQPTIQTEGRAPEGRASPESARQSPEAARKEGEDYGSEANK